MDIKSKIKNIIHKHSKVRTFGHEHVVTMPMVELLAEIEALDFPLTMEEVKNYGEQIREDNLDVPCPSNCEIQELDSGCINCSMWNIDKIKKIVREVK